MNECHLLPGRRVDDVTRVGAATICVAAHGQRPSGRCPDCGRASDAVHSRYRRRPADLPSFGREISLSLQVRRFYCRNGACARRTFAERLPSLVAPKARECGLDYAKLTARNAAQAVQRRRGPVKSALGS
jgi:transposase